MQTGLIFDIKRYAIHDGPGIRTTMFFKGCPFSCWWCHNPESLVMAQQKLYNQNRCIGCGECVSICPYGALRSTPRGVVTEHALCEYCGSCALVCPAEARELAGIFESVENLMRIIEKDILFYDESGGGATFSGGEPLLQADFLLELLKACGKHDIHRAIDTTGYANEDVLMAIAQETELFLFDLKLMDPDKHKKYTGVSNRKILNNLNLLARRGATITIRIPLLPGINDDDENINHCGTYISGLPGVQNVDILPYHEAARYKYLKLGANYHAKKILTPTKDQTTAVAQRLKSFGLKVGIGG
ncbi:MAG: glycyl-radical enzyme activating protein [Planctomycetota bacterium]|jgi:pyruvate formate lyase activating enzyme